MAQTPTDAADAMTQLFHTPLLKAIAEPARIEVLKVLLTTGGGDVATVASHLPQDRSVISRHLNVLEEAGVLRSTRQGRRRVYAFDGEAFATRFETLATQVRALTAVCCPPAPEPPSR